MLKSLQTLATGLALAAAFAAPAHAETYKIVHAGLRALYLAPLFVAMDRGMFKERNLEVIYKEIQSGALSSAALLSGEAQMTNDDLTGVAPLAKEGKLLMVYNLLDRMTMDMVVRKEAIEKSGISLNSDVKTRLKILKGLTIGITRPNAPTDVFARFLMKQAGLDPQRDATLVQVGGPAALSAAFRSGKIDAFMLSPPLPQTLARDGYGSIIVRNTAGELPDLRGITYMTLYTTKAFAKKEPAAVEAYTQGILEAMKWIKANPKDAIALMHEKWFRDTPEAALQLSFDSLLPAFSSTGVFSEESLKKVANAYRAVGENMNVDFREGGFWTNQFVSK
jgi:NitT/TauT family transport system substrate-binding protein